jgi:hypothetical protein
LQAGAIGHEFGDDPADRLVFGRCLSGRKLQKRDMMLDDCLDLRDVKLRADAIHARHILVHFDDQMLCRAPHLAGIVPDAHEVAVAVHR